MCCPQLTYSKHKQCNHQDASPDVQQGNISITPKQVNYKTILKVPFHAFKHFSFNYSIEINSQWIC